MLIHDRFWVIADPEAVRQDLHTRIVDLLPTVKPATLGHGTDSAGAHVMYIMEKHLVPPVASTEHKSHDRMKSRPSALRIRGKEFIPHVRVVYVREHRPS